VYDELKELHPRWMFMSTVGSQNYGTAIEGSDTDIKIAYLPTFEEFYYNKFEYMDTGSPTGDDYTLHPAHEFLSHAFKGNMNFWEVFYSDGFTMNRKLWESSGVMGWFLNSCKTYVERNPLANFNAMRGMAIQKDKQAYKEWNRNKTSFYKSAQHAMRMLDMIIDISENGISRLDISSDKDWLNWRSDMTITISEYAELFERKLKFVDELEFKFKHEQKLLRESREHNKKMIDKTMMNLILKNERSNNA
jgi:hypothetical protein